MQENIEDRLANYRCNLFEISSSLNILQRAVQNAHNEPEMSDIDHSLEIIIKKVNNAIDNMEFIEQACIK